MSDQSPNQFPYYEKQPVTRVAPIQNAGLFGKMIGARLKVKIRGPRTGIRIAQAVHIKPRKQKFY